MVALFCSVKCPGQLILDTYDLAKRFRKQGVTVISGFHSPMEQECLRILLRSPHPVIWCLARGLLKRIPSKPVDCCAAVAEGQLLIVSPFKESVRRVTAKTAIARNRFVVNLAAAVVVAHAPVSKMEALCRDILAAGKPLYTFDHPANAALIEAGARNVESLCLSDVKGVNSSEGLGACMGRERVGMARFGVRAQQRPTKRSGKQDPTFCI